jgi:hypothetical protein
MKSVSQIIIIVFEVLSKTTNNSIPQMIPLVFRRGVMMTSTCQQNWDGHTDGKQIYYIQRGYGSVRKTFTFRNEPGSAECCSIFVNYTET